MLKRLLRSVVVRSMAGRLVGLYLRLTLDTIRWTIDAPDTAWPYMIGAEGRTAIVAFWHEFLPLTPALWWHARRANPSLAMTVLISRHRDGQMITEIVGRWGVQVVAGSSERSREDGPTRRGKGGAAAMRGLMGRLRSGSLIAVTPDGPRGPRRVVQPGVVRLAAMSGVPLIAAAASCRPCRRLGSWDRMILPLPFGRGRIVCTAPMLVSPGDWQAAIPRLAASLDAASTAAGSGG